MVAATVNLRDTLWLAAALTLIAAPHAQRLPWWITALAATLVLWRIYLGRMRHDLPARWLLLAVVAGATAVIYLNYRTLFGRDAGVALLIVMLALKLLEARSRRDAMLLIFLGYFLVITNFLYAQTIPTAVYMLGCVWVITAAMIGLNYARPPGAYRHQLSTAGLLLAQSAPLMLVLFLFFPRVQGPLWGLPHDAHSGVTGLSDTMTPGNIIDLTLSDAVAFRVEFKSEVPPPRDLYWRGPVMWDFDGRTWRTLKAGPGVAKFSNAARAFDYVVTLEPHNDRWLFALDLPATVPPFAMATSDFQLRSFQPVTTRRRYEMRSFTEFSFGTEEHAWARERALQLPPGFNPRALEFARTLRQRFDDDRALVNAMLTMLRSEEFYYTLEPPPLGEHSVDDFLFRTRRGFCEHYASAFAVVMRAAGIPARIVTGYLGGEFNPLGGYMIVRQAEAHAWTEVWLRGEGWVRVDPTAAVSPLRVESGIAAAVSRTDALSRMMGGSYPWLKQLRLTWDSVANRWNLWVLGYNPERQRQLMAHVGIDQATWRVMAAILLAATTLIVLVLAALALRRLRTRIDDPVKRAYLAFCGKLGRKGLARGPAEGPLAYAERLARIRPDLAPAVASITGLYVALRYGSAGDGGTVHELLRQIRQFQA